jgi:biopolymer transport protein ExbD
MAGGASDDDGGLISSINVTPLVDVTLVLLIIFMVTARIIVSQGMPMDLPKAASGEEMQTVFSVELTEDGKTFVDSTQVAGDQVIGEMATEAKKKNPELRAVIRADQKVPHGRVIQVLDTLKQAKLSKVAFAVTPAAGAKPAKPAVTAPAQ